MVESCALQWKHTVEYVQKSAKQIPKERFMEVKYEDFISEPQKMLRAVGDMCELSWDNKDLNRIGDDLENRNYKWREKFSPSEIETLNSVLGDFLKKLGYEV
ncbi:sulfotransferase [Verrucomicrobiota bacterium]